MVFYCQNIINTRFHTLGFIFQQNVHRSEAILSKKHKSEICRYIETQQKAMKPRPKELILTVLSQNLTKFHVTNFQLQKPSLTYDFMYGKFGPCLTSVHIWIKSKTKCYILMIIILKSYEMSRFLGVSIFLMYFVDIV